MNESLFCETTNDIPRSQEYESKTIVQRDYVIIKGTRYFKRVFSDCCVELARYDYSLNKWVFLLFI